MEIEHIGLIVSNLKESIIWYKKNFGFKETVKKFDNPKLEIKGCLLQLGDVYLELLEPYRPRGVSKSRENSLRTLLQKVGSSHLAFNVKEIGSVYKKLKKNNVDLVTEIMPPAKFFCKDPDSYLIEVRGIINL